MSCLGYMCEFRDLEVKAVLLTDLMQSPDDPEDSYFFKNDVKVRMLSLKNKIKIYVVQLKILVYIILQLYIIHKFMLYMRSF